MKESMQTLTDRFGWRALGHLTAYEGVAIDDRQLVPGQLFVALEGERHDGHEFVAGALAAGAAGAVVSRPLTGLSPLLIADDTQLALGRLAALHREHWQGELFAVTGSAGKTTTKEMLTAILSRMGPVHATRGNFNNEIGVPLTLFDLRAEHRSAVLEMGAAKPGDIAYLVEMAKPVVSILTNAMPAHLEGFGSLAQVAATKGQIFVPRPECVAVVNLDSDFAEDWCGQAGDARVVGFSLAGNPAAEVRTEQLQFDASGSRFVLVCPEGRCGIRLQVPGVHNVANALAASAAAQARDVPLNIIREGLQAFAGVDGRLQICHSDSGLLVIDDSYNANPEAVRSALDVLAMQDGEKLFIFGDMAELGVSAPELHARVGRDARERGIDGLLALGPLARHAAHSFGPDGYGFDSLEQLLNWLDQVELPDRYQNCLVKGSRSARMENVVNYLLGLPAQADSVIGGSR